MNQRECVFELIENGQCDEIIASPLVGFHSAILFKKNIKEVCTSSELMATLQIKAARFYELPIVFNFMDLTLEAEALGAEVFWDGELPSIKRTLPYSEAEIILENGVLKFLESKRIKSNIEAVRIMSGKLKEALVGAYVAGPLTLMAQTFGVTRIIKQIKKNPINLKKLLKRTSQIIRIYIDSLTEANATLIMILEPVGALLSPQMFENIIMDPLKELIEYVNKKGVLSALHICGDTNHLLEKMVNIGPNILSIDKQVDITRPLEISDRIIVLGNVGTVELQQDTPENIYNQTCTIIEKTEGVRHIVSSGCDVPIYSKPENVKMIIKAARKWKNTHL